MVCCSEINCHNRTEEGYRLFPLPANNEKNKARHKAWLHNCKSGNVGKTLHFCEVISTIVPIIISKSITV